MPSSDGKSKKAPKEDPTVDMTGEQQPASGHLVFTASGDVMLPPRPAPAPLLLNATLEPNRAKPRPMGLFRSGRVTLPSYDVSTIRPDSSGLFTTLAQTTGLSRPNDTSYLTYPRYKIEHNFLPHAWICVYVREDICCRRLGNFEEDRVRIYRSHSGNAETDHLIDCVQAAIDDMLAQIPSAEIVALGDFNGHNAEWLGSRTTDYAGRSVHNFALAYVADVILQGMDIFIPISVVPIGGRSQPWFDASVKAASDCKKQAYRTWFAALGTKDSDCKVLKRKYYRASRFCQRQIARANSKHVVKIGEQLSSYPTRTRKFWSLSKAVLGNFNQPSLPPLHMKNDTLDHTAKEKADLLSMREVQFRQKTVRRALFSLDVRKSSGPDGISPIVLRTCAPELTPALTRLFQHSYSKGVVPDSWK
ncbi:unnamed protein product [Leptidea sinapis]|uniref:Endonuclease/exonuclease/phosphatase domain-containing protein n=1 Tax=Leptidea sinapis TaxID=189913 RepID=A0A5E4QJU7_9NEOP|nr:unnamed protein product [Leptidea sinapis]